MITSKDIEEALSFNNPSVDNTVLPVTSEDIDEALYSFNAGLSTDDIAEIENNNLDTKREENTEKYGDFMRGVYAGGNQLQSMGG